MFSPQSSDYTNPFLGSSFVVSKNMSTQSALFALSWYLSAIIPLGRQFRKVESHKSAFGRGTLEGFHQNFFKIYCNFFHQRYTFIILWYLERYTGRCVPLGFYHYVMVLYCFLSVVFQCSEIRDFWDLRDLNVQYFETWTLILFQDLSTCATVCRFLRRAASDESLWRKLYVTLSTIALIYFSSVTRASNCHCQVVLLSSRAYLMHRSPIAIARLWWPEYLNIISWEPLERKSLV